MHLTDEQLNEYLDHEADDRIADRIAFIGVCALCGAIDCACKLCSTKSKSLLNWHLSPDFAVAFPVTARASLLHCRVPLP